MVTALRVGAPCVVAIHLTGHRKIKKDIKMKYIVKMNGRALKKSKTSKKTVLSVGEDRDFTYAQAIALKHWMEDKNLRRIQNMYGKEMVDALNLSESTQTRVQRLRAEENISVEIAIDKN